MLQPHRGYRAAEAATALPGASTARGRVQPPPALLPSYRCFFTARTEQTKEEQPRALQIPNFPMPWGQMGTEQQFPALRGLSPSPAPSKPV